jgi:signal transduction histidine kinase
MFETLQSIPRSVGAFSLSVFGLLLAAIHAYHLLTDSAALFPQFIGSFVPMVLALVLAVLGPLLYWSRLDATAITTTVAWGYIGGLVLGCIAILIATHQVLKGANFHGPGYIIAAAVTGGALVGTVTGRYDALNRQKADLIVSLQDATSALSAATTTDEVCRCAVEIANNVLDIPITGIWLYDEEQNALVPEAIADPARGLFDSAPTYRPGNSLSWGVFESGTIERYDDIAAETGTHNPDTIIRSEMIIPLDDVGIMNFGSTEPGRFDELDTTVAALLGTATEAALVRADREETLRTHQQLLEQQNERLEEFTSVVSHDLRNPLAVAEGRVELAKDDDDEEHLTAAATALDTMESLIEDLLELSKQGHAVGETERVSLQDIAEAAWRNIESEKATIDIEDAEFDADADRLRQLLENLFGNAVAHADPGPAIRVGPLPDTPGFFVADDGPGIAPDDRNRIFDIGYTDHEDGTGFGLSIVRRIADAHGWEIRLLDGDDEGARFEFRFG